MLAHQVEIADDVAATLHIEPNDLPKANEPTQVWFILTRRGGKLIPLADCQCKLTVELVPRTPSSPPLLEPLLQPRTSEGYRGIPGAEITFPQSGKYELVLSGTPKPGKSFKPFRLEYPVTVTAKAATSSPTVAQPQGQNPPGRIDYGLIGAIALSGLGIIAIALIWQKKRRWRSKNDKS
jgi:hypothetical protein